MKYLAIVSPPTIYHFLVLSYFSRIPLVSDLAAECAAAVTVGEGSGVNVSFFLVIAVGDVVVSSN